MANVGFKRGLQAAIDVLIGQGTSANATDGVFYLTSDTNRLYIGKDDGSVAPVNEGVITVDSVANLPTIIAGQETVYAGRFYYAAAENVLCTYSGKNWVQINAFVRVTKITSKVEAAADKADITTELTQTGGTTLTDTFSIQGAGGLKVESTGTADDPVVTITQDKLTLESEVVGDDATLKITSETGTNDSEVKVEAGTNVTITQNATEDGIVITSKNTKMGQVTITAKAEGYDIKVSDSDGTSSTGTLNPTIAYGKNGDLSAKFVNGTLTLPVYSKDELEAKITEELKLFNAMEYMGTIGVTGSAGTELPDTSVKNGYVYMLSSELNINGNMYPPGTLVIAQGPEGADGYIPSGALEWTCIEGAGTDTTYKGVAITGGMKLQDSSNKAVATLTAVGGTQIVVDSSATSGDTQELTIKHATIDREDTTGSAQEQVKNHSIVVPVITNITTDNGHITGVETSEYTIWDTNAELNDIGLKITAAQNVANVQHSFSLKQGDGSSTVAKTVTFGVTSDSLTVGASGGSVKLDMTWGDF